MVDVEVLGVPGRWCAPGEAQGDLTSRQLGAAPEVMTLDGLAFKGRAMIVSLEIAVQRMITPLGCGRDHR